MLDTGGGLIALFAVSSRKYLSDLKVPFLGAKVFVQQC